MKLRMLVMDTMITIFIINIPLIQSKCSRKDSRIAQNIIEEVLVPVFEDTSLLLPSTCPLNPSLNMFSDNELHKLWEDASRWSCQYCGKGFVAQNYLDTHFDNRHTQTILQPPAGVCLGDYCDIMRCEVLDDYYKPLEYCNETQMDLLKSRCEKTVKQCVPENLAGMKKYSFINDMRLAVCAYLTCERYNEKPFHQASPLWTLVGILIGISFVFSAGIFFLLIFTDTLAVDPVDEVNRKLERREEREKYVAIRIPGEEAELRHRHREDWDNNDSDR